MGYLNGRLAFFGGCGHLQRHGILVISCLALMSDPGLAGPQTSAAASAVSQKATSWTLSSDDTLLTVSVEGGRPALRTLRSKVATDNWLRGRPKEKLMETIQVDGSVVKTDWKFQSADLDEKKEQLTLHFTNADPRLELNSIWRARPGPGPVEHWLTIANDSGQTVTVTHQDSLALDGLTLAVNESADVWWINRGGINASRQGGAFVAKVDTELDQILKSDPGNPSSPVPWLAIQVGTLRGLYMGWEFSGIGRIHAKTVSSNPTHLSVRVGNMPEFKTDLNAGETFLVPPAFVGCYRGEIDDGSYSLHRFVLGKLVPPLPKDKPYPSLVYNFWVDNLGNVSKGSQKHAPLSSDSFQLTGPMAGAALQLLGPIPTEAELAETSRKTTEAELLYAAAQAHDFGFETFMVDGVWFPQTGDWRWDPARFPHGDRSLREFLNQHGMQLGLWMAYTHGSDSDDPGAMNVFRHADWFTKTYPPEWKSRYWNWVTLFDLGSDPANNWAKQETQRVVRDYRVDYFKHDYSPIVTQCAMTSHRHKYGVDVGYWSTLGYYQVQEALKQRFPELVLEGCSGGGHIKDFGYIRRVNYIATTDTMSSLPNRQSIWDSTFAFPPAVLMAYTRENMYNRDSDQPRPYFWRTAMMSAWQIIPGNSASWTNEEKAGVQRAVEIYKSWVRPILRDATVHHILPRPDDLHWDGMFYWSPALGHGTLYIFRPDNDQVFQRVRLKGLSGGQHYHIWSEDGSVAEGIRTGADLMNPGLGIKLPSKYSSDLIYVEKH